MESGSISLATLDGPFDLQSTLESGQTYCWRRTDGRTYETAGAHGGDAAYVTTTDGEAIEVRQTDGHLRWRATVDAESALVRLLRLDDDLEAIRRATPADPLLDAAFDAYPGMRLVRDPFFPTLIAFICSAQMRVERIYAMQAALRTTYGDPIAMGDETVHAFPTPGRLAAASEAELRELGLGYRAPYVRETAAMVADGDRTAEDVSALPYEAAREAMTDFVGVGEKVADCVLLFSLGYLEAVPLDTWIRQAIAEYYPDCDRGSYAETSRAIRARFGGEYAGYAQTYVFHYLRNRE